MVGEIIDDLLHVYAPQKILWLLPNRWANTFMTTKKQGVKGLEEVLEGSEGAYKQVSARQMEGLVRGNTWLWFGERGCSAWDTGTTKVMRKTTHVTTTKKKPVGSFFFLFLGGGEWAKRSAHSFCGKSPIKTRRSWSYSSNPGLSMARSASLYEPIFDPARGFEKWD